MIFFFISDFHQTLLNLHHFIIAMGSLLENLSLSLDEKEKLILEVGSNKQQREWFELCLVGRFLTDR